MGGPGLFPGFRDATHRPSTFDLSILDCYTGLLAGQAQGWYDMDTFNTEQYEAYADPSAFDMHILSPKFLAFRGPNCHDDRFPDAAVYRDEFVLLGVTGVIRLNEPDCYDKAVFEDAGIKHYDLFFDDCTMPDAATAQKFLDICNENEGMLAVHCLAGLGRTGTLICLWLMLHLGWSARESIAWCRLVRPGCIIGMQQHYLQRWEHQLKHANGALPDPDDVHLPQTTLKASKQKSKGAVAEAGSREESASMARDVAAGMRRKANTRLAVVEAAELGLGFIVPARRGDHTPVTGRRGDNTPVPVGRTSSLEQLLGPDNAENYGDEDGEGESELGVWEEGEWEDQWAGGHTAVI